MLFLILLTLLVNPYYIGIFIIILLRFVGVGFATVITRAMLPKAIGFITDSVLFIV